MMRRTKGNLKILEIFFENKDCVFVIENKKTINDSFFLILWELELVPGVSSFVVLLAVLKFLPKCVD